MIFNKYVSRVSTANTAFVEALLDCFEDVDMMRFIYGDGQ